MSRDAILAALAEARAAREHSAALAQMLLPSWLAGLDRLIAGLERALEGDVQDALQALPEPVAPPCPHRAAHRPGKPRRIDNDPELRAFIAARIDRLTFHQLEAEIAASFPPERHVGKSAIHAWWQRQKPGKKADRPG